MASEAHTWGLIYLELLLTEWGHRVDNLGPCVPDADILAQCTACRPDLVVVSSVNGHGFDEGLRLARFLRGHPGFGRIPLVIGGKLGVGQADDDTATAALSAAGFDLVVCDEDPVRLREYLSELRQVARC